jgi:hypothetical protein
LLHECPDGVPGFRSIVEQPLNANPRAMKSVVHPVDRSAAGVRGLGAELAGGRTARGAGDGQRFDVRAGRG